MSLIWKLPKDFHEFLQLLNAHSVDYVIVGGYAVARHGYPRFTGDLDVLVFPERRNAARLLAALADFGFSLKNLTEDDFGKPDHVVQLGIPPLRIDLITSVSGVSNEKVFCRKVTDTDGEFPIHFISLEELIENKKATGRPQDLADLACLQKPTVKKRRGK